MFSAENELIGARRHRWREAHDSRVFGFLCSDECAQDRLGVDRECVVLQSSAAVAATRHAVVHAADVDRVVLRVFG